jgi:hypothetical protein
MLGPRRRMLLSLLVALVALTATALAACGDGGTNRDELLSPTAASELRSTLAEVQQRVEDGDCTGAGEQAQTLEQQAGSLPVKVEANLRDALVDGASRLQKLVLDRCEAPATGPTVPAAPTAPPAEEGENQNGGKDKKEKPGKAKGHEKRTGEEQNGGSVIEPGGDSGTTGGQGGTSP